MWMQAAGIAVTALATDFAGFAAGAVLLGLGTAMVYPTLLAAIGDVASPTWRASAVGFTGCGATSVMPLARSWPALSPMRSDSPPPSGWWQESLRFPV